MRCYFLGVIWYELDAILFKLDVAFFELLAVALFELLAIALYELLDVAVFELLPCSLTYVR